MIKNWIILKTYRFELSIILNFLNNMQTSGIGKIPDGINSRNLFHVGININRTNTTHEYSQL